MTMSTRKLALDRKHPPEAERGPAQDTEHVSLNEAEREHVLNEKGDKENVNLYIGIHANCLHSREASSRELQARTLEAPSIHEGKLVVTSSSSLAWRGC